MDSQSCKIIFFQKYLPNMRRIYDQKRRIYGNQWRGSIKENLKNDQTMMGLLPKIKIKFEKKTGIRRFKNKLTARTN